MENDCFINTVNYFSKKVNVSFVMCKICRYFAQILKSTMNQQEIRSKYYLHSMFFIPKRKSSSLISKNDILVLW